MSVRHSIAGVPIRHTASTLEVLGDMGALTSLVTENPPPHPLERLILEGRIRYAYEPRQEDLYLPWWQWPQVAMSDWERWKEHLWDHNPQVYGYGLPEAGSGLVAIDDCEGFACNAVGWRLVNGYRAWPMVEEHKHEVTGQLRGWHAVFVLEVPDDGRIWVAEVPLASSAWILDSPALPYRARPGYRLAVIDLAWMAGMPRRKEGRFPLSSYSLVTARR